jgi:hypothetical protein
LDLNGQVKLRGKKEKRKSVGLSPRNKMGEEEGEEGEK